MFKHRAFLLLPLLAVSLISTVATIAPAHADGICANLNCTQPPPPPPPPPPHHPHNPDNPNDPGAPGTGETRKVSVLIDCRVSGDPKLLPDDLKFRNIGTAIIPQGTRVVWQIKETGEHGQFLLRLDLLPGDEVPDLAALDAGMPRTNHCFSKIAV